MKTFAILSVVTFFLWLAIYTSNAENKDLSDKEMYNATPCQKTFLNMKLSNGINLRQSDLKIADRICHQKELLK